MVDQEEQGDLPLPPGFRFHPTDEEVVTSYLVPKSLNPTSFNPRAIAVVNLNRCEPWDLPSKAKMGEKDQWYFFCQKDMKYPTGTRTNRATEKGYWKATGKDREIFKPGASPGDGGGRRDDQLIGMKKTLVFYTGRAPRGTKTNWVMHEFRLEGAYRNHPNLRLSPKDEWVVCKVFHKSNGEEDKKAAAAAVEDFAAGTPTVSSISVDATGAVDGGDEFLDSMFFDPYFDYSTGTFPADNHAATMMNDVGGFFGPPYDAFDDDRTSRNPLHQAAAVSSATVPLVPTSSSGSYRSSWNTVPSHYATGSSSYNLHDQAMMARALGGAGFPNFAGGGGFPSYSVPGISQQNSLRRRGYATGRLASSAAAAAANITGQAAKNLGP